MSHNLTGIYFENQVIASKGLRAHARRVLSDGVIQGCELSFSGASVTIAPGFLMAGGGLMHNSAAQTLEVSGATSGYARIKAIIDLSKTATKTAFEQAWFEVDYSSTLEGFADPVQEDINAGGTVYELVLCILFLGVSGVTSIVQGTPEPSIVCGISMKKLWGNASPNSNFNAQTLTLDGLNDYDVALIATNRIPYSDHHIPGDALVEKRFSGANFYINIPSYDSGVYICERRVSVNFSAETVVFADATQNGTSNNARVIPIAIYGIKGVQQ